MQKFRWEGAAAGMSQEFMDRRIAASCAGLGWQRAVHHLLSTGTSFTSMQVAEIGCGTGTLALTMALLGARITLVDADERALEVARTAFALYGCTADAVRADVLTSPTPELRGRFDFVSSSGLAEHFVGEERTVCLSFHREVLRDGGLARVSVPNRLSPWYRMVKAFRTLTGTWRIDLEIPYSPGELRRVAHCAGFSRFDVIGNNPLTTDALDYSLGLASAVRKVLIPRGTKGAAMLSEVRKSAIVKPVRERVRDAVERIRLHPPSCRRTLKDSLSAGIVLLGCA